MKDPNVIHLLNRKPPPDMSPRDLTPWAMVGLVFTLLALAADTSHTNPFPANHTSSVDPSGLSTGGIAACGLIRRTCDGDTGWQNGRKWRLTGIDAPEIGGAECAREREIAEQSTTRLIELMPSGYRIEWSGKDDRYGRPLVDVRLADGRDAGAVLMSEGLAQPWPNSGNVWCRS